MPPTFEEIWIVRADGAMLFHKADGEERVQKDLFGGFISAINTVASMLDKGGLESIELGGKKLSMVKQENVFFIGSHDRKAKHEKVSKLLRVIADTFFDRYDVEIVETWRGNTVQFSGFADAIDDVTDEFLIAARAIFQ